MRTRALLALATLLLSGCAAPGATNTGGPLEARSGVLPAWIAGQAGRASIDITGGTPPYQCALAQGSALPEGFQLEGCNVTGTAPMLAPGSSKSISPPFAVDVTDSATPQAGTRALLQVAIEMPPPRIVVVPAGTCTVDVLCVLPLATVENAQPPYSLTAFPRPDGMSFDGTTGIMRGTPTQAGAHRVEVCVSDLVGSRDCGTALLTIVAAGGDDGGEDAPPTPPTPPTPEPFDDTPTGVTLYYTTCVARPDGSAFEVRASGVASGVVGATLVVLIFPVGSAPAIPSQGILMDADWSLLPAAAEPYEPLGQEAAAPVPQRENGEAPEGSWSLTNALAPLGESDVEYRVVARAFPPDGGNGTVEDETVRCFAPRTPASVAILTATCTLNSKTNIPPGAGGAQIAWSWTIRLSGNLTGPKDERFGVNLGQPYVRMPKSGGTLVADWTGRPTRNVGNGDPGWTLHRATTDPKSANWSVADLVVTHQDYEVYYDDYETEWSVLAQVGQEVARTTFSCPK